MSAYSTNFFCGQPPLAGGVVYTVPAGYTVVVRDIELTNWASSSQSMNVACDVSGSLGTIYMVNAAPASSWHQWTGRTVVPAGGTISAYCGSVAGNTAVISGYLLID